MQNTSQTNPITHFLIFNRPVTRWLFKPLVVGMIVLLGAFTPHAVTTTVTHAEEVLALLVLISLVWGMKIIFINQMFKG